MESSAAAQPLDEEDLPEEEESAVGHLWKLDLLDNDGATKAACDRAYSAYIRHTNGSRGIVVRNRADEPSRVYLPLSLADEGPRMAELRRVVDVLCPEPAKLALLPPSRQDSALFDSIVDTLLPMPPEVIDVTTVEQAERLFGRGSEAAGAATFFINRANQPKETSIMSNEDSSEYKVLKAVREGAADRGSIAEAAGLSQGRAGICLSRLVEAKTIVAVGATKSRRFYVPGAVPAGSDAPKEKAPRAKAPKVKPAAKKPMHQRAKKSVAAHVDEDGAVALLVAKRQRHLDAVERLDMVIAVLSEGAS